MKIEQLTQVIRERDTGKIERAAHALKGMAGHFGAARLVSICTLLETQAMANSVSSVEAIWAELETEFKRVEAALTDEKSRRELIS